MASMRTGIQVQGGVGLTDLWGFGGKLPGPALVGLAPTQAIKLRAFSPNSSRSPNCSNVWAEGRGEIPALRGNVMFLTRSTHRTANPWEEKNIRQGLNTDGHGLYI